MISAGELRNGVTMEYEGEIYSVLEFQHVKPADTVLNALMDYFTVSMQASGMTEEEIAEVTTMMNGEMVDMNAFSSTVLALKTSLEAALEEEAVASVLNGFHYEEELIQSGGQFRSTSNTVLENGNDEVFRISSSATMQQASGSVVFPSLSIKLEEMMTNLQALTDQYNPRKRHSDDIFCITPCMTWRFLLRYVCQMQTKLSNLRQIQYSIEKEK